MVPEHPGSAGTSTQNKSRYLKDLFESVYIKDVLERNRILNDRSILEDLLNIISSSVGSLTNPTKLSNTFRSVRHVQVNANTISRYLDCFIDAFILEKACQSEKKGNLSTSTRQFIAVVVKHRRTDMMSFIANSYISLYCKHKHIVKGKVVLPIAANKDLLKRLQTFVQEQTRQAVDLELEVDKHIGGGFILQYDTYRYDASLRTRLDKLQRSLKV